MKKLLTILISITTIFVVSQVFAEPPRHEYRGHHPHAYPHARPYVPAYPYYVAPPVYPYYYAPPAYPYVAPGLGFSYWDRGNGFYLRIR